MSTASPDAIDREELNRVAAWIDVQGDEDYRQRLLTHAEELLGIVLRTRNPAHQIAAIAAGLAGANDAGAGRV